MVLIGITGPTGAGKTTLLREVEALGGAVIDCDAVYHELLEHDPILQHELERRFGPLRGENGSIDRKRLGAIVFGDPEKLAQLNAVAPDSHRGPDPGAGGGVPAAGESPGRHRRHRTGGERAGPPVFRHRGSHPPRRRCGCAGSWPGRGSRRTTPGPGCGPRSPEEYFRGHCGHVLVNDCASAEEFSVRAKALLQTILQQTTKEV